MKLLYILALLLPAEAFNGCYDRLCTIKWFDLCLSITLRVIFKWLIKGESWIIVYGSKWMYKELFKYLAITAYFLTRLLNQ